MNHPPPVVAVVERNQKEQMKSDNERGVHIGCCGAALC